MGRKKGVPEQSPEKILIFRIRQRKPQRRLTEGVTKNRELEGQKWE